MTRLEFLGAPLEDWTAVTNVLLTIGLLLFAGMQWWVTHQAEKSRRLERESDERVRRAAADSTSDTAFQTIWAEHFRLETLATHWGKSDLVLLSALRVLRSDDLLPRDWPTLMRAFGHLSKEAGWLGSVALTLAYDTERDVATLNAIVDSFAKQYPGRSPGELAELVRSNRKADVETLERTTVVKATDLALIMWDAARQSARATVDRTWNFSDDLKSKFASDAVRALKIRSEATPEAGEKPSS